MRCAPSLTPKQKRESDDSPILRHGFAVPPPLPKEANVTAGFRRYFVGDDAHIVPNKKLPPSFASQNPPPSRGRQIAVRRTED